MRIVTPLRFASGVVGLWIMARVVILLPGDLVPSAEADVPSAGTRTRYALAGAISPTAALRSVRANPPIALQHQPGRRGGLVLAQSDRRPSIDSQTRLPAVARPATPSTLAVSAPSPTGLMPPLLPGTTAAALSADSRWSGSIYLFRRDKDGTPALATGGQLGGSQAGARLAYSLNPQFAVAARLSTPLDDHRGAEAAVGVDWHPVPGKPLRLSVERRVDVGGAGRNAWSAYAAGGFWRQIRPGFVVDGYGQGGIVGARRGDLFADGALRAGHRREIGGGGSLIVGGGVWGAAQPGVARLDIGPRAALGLPVAGTTVTAAAEWRIRAAGDASPRSGLALTLSSDF